MELKGKKHKNEKLKEEDVPRVILPLETPEFNFKLQSGTKVVDTLV